MCVKEPDESLDSPETINTNDLSIQCLECGKVYFPRRNENYKDIYDEFLQMYRINNLNMNTLQNIPIPITPFECMDCRRGIIEFGSLKGLRKFTLKMQADGALKEASLTIDISLYLDKNIFIHKINEKKYFEYGKKISEMCV